MLDIFLYVKLIVYDNILILQVSKKNRNKIKYIFCVIFGSDLDLNTYFIS